MALTALSAVTADQFFQHVEAFFDYRQTIYESSEQTVKSNRIDIRLFRNFIKERHYQTIDGPAVMAFQYYLKQQRTNCGSSINRKLFTLRSYAQFLRLEQVEAADQLPFYHVLKIRQGYRNRPQALKLDQIKQLFQVIDRSTLLGIRDYVVYALMYLLGLRVGEVHRLNLEDVDLKHQTITVFGKGKRRRILQLTPEMANILTEWLAVRRFFLNSQQINALFVSKKGKRLAIRTMEDNFKIIINKLSLHVYFKVTCHTLRHSFASHLNDTETDVLVIQSLLGHSSPRSTQIYIHPSELRIRQALEKLPGVIYMNQLIESGILNLTFQNKYRPKRE